jgi:enterochelin esterase-like enzyme
MRDSYAEERVMSRSVLSSVVAVSLCCAGLAVPSGTADVLAEGPKGRVVEIALPAPSLEGNLLGTPTTQRALVYLPRGYDEDEGRRYPAVYLLHGIFDEPEVWVRHFRVPEILDRLAAAGRIEPGSS